MGGREDLIAYRHYKKSGEFDAAIILTDWSWPRPTIGLEPYLQIEYIS